MHSASVMTRRVITLVADLAKSSFSQVFRFANPPRGRIPSRQFGDVRRPVQTFILGAPKFLFWIIQTLILDGQEVPKRALEHM